MSEVAIGDDISKDKLGSDDGKRLETYFSLIMFPKFFI